MYGQLGDIVFDKLYGLDSFNLKGSQVISEHARISGKPRLENSGAKADEIAISFMLSAYFTNPEEEIDKIKGYKDTAEILVFLDGSGVVFGDFVIREYDYTIDDMTPTGKILNATVNVTLIENFYTDRKKAELRSAANNGFGAPGAISKVAPISMMGESAPVMADISKVNNDVSSVGSSLSKAEKIASQANQWMDTASKKLDETRTTINGLQEKLTSSLNLGSGATNLLSQIPALLASINALQTPLNAHDLLTSLGLNSLLQAQQSLMNTYAAPIAGMVATKL